MRLGLAAGRPVATTPLPIFANLAGIIHPLAGGSAADIAAGIIALLRDPDRCAFLLQRQRDWVRRNSWRTQAARLDDIIRSTFARRHGIAPSPPPPAQREPVRLDAAPDRQEERRALAARAAARLTRRPQPSLAGPPVPRPELGRAVEWLPVMRVGPVGERTATGIGGKAGEAGHLVYGPYVRLGAGDYRVRIRCGMPPTEAAPSGQAVATIEAVSEGGKTYLAQRELTIEECARPEHDLLFRIDATALQPVEVRVWTSGLAKLTVSSIAIERIALSPTSLGGQNGVADIGIDPAAPRSYQPIEAAAGCANRHSKRPRGPVA